MNTRDRASGSWTEPLHAQFISEICEYKYGIFAYSNFGQRLATQARKAKSATPSRQESSLHKFRPMFRGLLTDESRRQFILWRVDKGPPDFLVIKWRDMRDWLDGMENGQYIGLKARHIRTGRMLEARTSS